MEECWADIRKPNIHDAPRPPGGTWSFTVNLADRHADTLVQHIDDLRAVVNSVKARHPFAIVAMVVLPEHLHAVWRLPPDDVDYSLRWSLLKAGFARLLDKTESMGLCALQAGEAWLGGARR